MVPTGKSLTIKHGSGEQVILTDRETTHLDFGQRVTPLLAGPHRRARDRDRRHARWANSTETPSRSDWREQGLARNRRAPYSKRIGSSPTQPVVVNVFTVADWDVVVKSVGEGSASGPIKPLFSPFVPGPWSLPPRKGC
jgi:hypothetical protein